jgi:hypothetical protein
MKNTILIIILLGLCLVLFKKTNEGNEVLISCINNVKGKP